jgi:predicted nucleic acid-binding protein
MAAHRPPSPTEVFLDTSVLFAAAHSPNGYARDLVVAGMLGQLALCLSPFVVDETRRNLAHKSARALPFFEAFLTRGVVHSIEPPAALVEQGATVVAIKDAPIVAGAVHAGATFLATYDRKDLLSKRQEILAAFGVTVATPEEFLASL